MKKLKKFTVLTVALSVSASLFVGQAAAATYGTEVTYGVNLREDPSTSSSVHRMLKKGENIRVLGQVNDYWLKIETKDGKVGYISASEKYTNYDGSVYAKATGGVNFRSAPKVSNNKIGFISRGDTVKVLDEVNSYWLKVEYNGKVGYTSTSYFDYDRGSAESSPSSSANTATAIKGVNFRSGASVGSSKIGFISKGSKVEVIEQVNSYWLKVKYNGKTGYASPSYFDYKAPAKPAPNAKASEIIKTAKSYLGDFKYKWGAEPWNTNYKYSDCSSFVQLVFNKKHGYDLPRVSKNQAKEGSYVKKSNLKAGDLVFFDTTGNGKINHVGIYIGDGDFIHSSPINEVGISNLDKGYWKDKYETGRRVL